QGDKIKDISNVQIDELLQYNLVDSLSTWFVYERYWDQMVADDQQEIYETIFKPATKDIIQMQLTGMPLDMDQVVRVKEILSDIHSDATERVRDNPHVKDYYVTLANNWANKRNQELKVKRVTPNDFNEEFNPNSSRQLVGLLYQHLNLPIIELTDSK